MNASESIAFLGSPEVSASTLTALHEAGHKISLVVTAPERRRGRGGATSATPVGEIAQALGIPVSHNVADVVDAGATLGVVVAFGQIIRPHILDRVPMVNIHFSLLPRWRGAAPVERAILAGDAETGVCIMEVVEALDAGGVYASTRVPIGDRSARELTTELGRCGTSLLLDCLTRGFGSPEPQQGEVTYAAKILVDDLRLDWSEPAEVSMRQIRVGGAWTTFRGERFRIHDARIEAGTLVPVRVQPAGKQVLEFDDWARGARLAESEWFL